MSFQYKITDQSYDKEYKVWEYDKMRKECAQPGVYIITDIAQEILYVGESENVGQRVRDHITGTEQSKRGFIKRICNIRIYLFGTLNRDITDMKMCEHWAKREYPPLFSKDSIEYDGGDTIEYLSDSYTVWENWHKYYATVDDEVVDGKEYQEKLKAANLKLK
ncbi:GIY-YIG nuclease family protein [Priestia megaterium]|uniref:GIY-YIG nuclease family protein n=1 Tax=Priestia megaterium TaxID=1404 RepID=UPI0015D50234|nr:GIY-YIG nuclease family protein [Priestia megaterium]